MHVLVDVGATVVHPSSSQIGLLMPWRASANVCTVQLGLLVQYILVAAIEDKPAQSRFCASSTRPEAARLGYIQL